VAQAEKNQVDHAKACSEVATEVAEMKERAKDNTMKMMKAIEKSDVDENAIPELSELRQMVEGERDTKKGGPTPRWKAPKIESGREAAE
jgi:hypothetical protein